MPAHIKIDFTLDAPAAYAVDGIRPGDVLAIRQQPVQQEPQAADGEAEAQQEKQPALAWVCCRLEGGAVAGAAPATVVGHIARYREAHASVRSVKRDASGSITQLQLRIELAEDGPVLHGEGGGTWGRSPSPSCGSVVLLRHAGL